MQLSNKGSIASALATATCSLLASQSVAAETPSDPNPWQFDTALLYYGETDRVTAIEGVINASKDFGDEHIFNGKLVIDALTGASATGAVAQPYAQTFTRPSGQGQYTIGANEVPLDDTFHDTRLQVSGQWTQPISENYRVSGGLQMSNEYDYQSIVLNGSIARDFNQKNSTLSLGMSYAFDTIKPEGGLPVAFSSMAVYDDDEYESEDEYDDDYNATRNDDSDTKNTLDLMLGYTQVINRRTIMQFNYGISKVDGYTTDPFKVLSVVDSEGYTQANLYENRPDSRTKQSFFWQTKYAADVGVADISYRFSTDDWEIDSHTVDTRFRFYLSENSYLQPHFRYYRQSAADFYRPFLLQDQAIPEYASADYRLGEMTAYTIGLKYGMTLENGDELGFRLEYYQQDPKNAGFNAPGVLQQMDLYPSVKAIIAQVNYRF